MRFLTAGESHGEQLTAIIEGLPAGIPITTKAINYQLLRRQQGYGRGGRMKIETDQAEITSGLRKGFTLGSPLTLTVANNDWKNWQSVMNCEGVGDMALSQKKKVICPRPGHADLVGGLKYGHCDLRNVLERSSARETTMRVAIGAVAQQLLATLNIKLFSYVASIGQVKLTHNPDLTNEQVIAHIENSPVRVADTEIETKMINIIKQAKLQRDTVGGTVTVVVQGMPAGIGSYVHYDRKLDAVLAKGLVSIQAVKGVEFGLGFTTSRMFGSQVHDEIIYEQNESGISRKTNRLGGIEGGMSNGQDIVITIAMKPIATLMKPLQTINIETKETASATVERSDTCAVPALAVIAENVVAWELASMIVDQLHADSLTDLQTSLAYLKQKMRHF